VNALPAPAVLAELRQRFRDGKAALLADFARQRASAPAAARLLRALSRHVDRTLLALWQRCALPTGAALVAVGGYGRGEQFPHSDVDVLLLLPEGRPADGDEAAIGNFVTGCWDLGLEVGSAVRSAGQCLAESERDITVRTALLESRFVCGARRTYEDFRRRHDASIDASAFLRAKTLEMRQRQQKYEDTPYALEPNCKESPGGLRDLQMLVWVARAAGLGRRWSEMAAHGLLTPFEVRQLQRHEAQLRLIRAHLHLVAGRREDRLVFDLQSAVAESLGLASTPTQRASELLMRRYYWAAKAVVQLNQILLLNIEERVSGREAAPMRPLADPRFLDRGGMLEVIDDELYRREPQAILQTFYAYQCSPGIKGLSARTLRALYHARGLMNAAFRRDAANRRSFMQILQHRDGGQTHALRLMNQTSVLGRYLWVFRRIVGRMQHDLFHVYTVDQHILMVLRNIRRFFIPEHAHEYPFCSQLALHWDKPWLLYVAALFHDVAKGRGGDHSELGAAEVRRFCRDHGIAGDDAALVEFLVREHLAMSRIAQKEDLSDPEVIAAFARLVGEPRRLDALYLLTVADIRGTSPKVWNAWKGKLLEDLYRLTLRALGGERPNLDAEIEARKTEARALLALASQPPGTEEALWRTLEVSYFARHDAADIAWHARVLGRLVESPLALVCARASSVGEGLQVLVYAPDRADLFARICGYFDTAGYSIQDAKIHTTRAGYALDTFQVVHPQVEPAQAAGYRDLGALVESGLREALTKDAPLPEPRRSRGSRRVRSFPVTPRVSLRPDERAQRWLLSVSTSDRAGLLYAIARVLARHHVNLQLAKVTTLGERVEDTFLVDGSELNEPRAQLQIELELLDAISPPTA
jgi:[protein-PII] uridylyltransferase